MKKHLIALPLTERAPQDLGGNNAKGIIYLANESRFNAAHFSEGLTGYAVGWKDNADLEAELELLAPRVPVPEKFEHRTANNAEAFYAEVDDSDIRAIGADFKLVQYSGGMELRKTLNKGLTVRIDLDEAFGEMYEELQIARLMRRLKRIEVRRAANVLQAIAANVAKTWDTTAGKDPDMDVIEQLRAASDTAGIRPNRVLFGETAWDKRALSHRAQESAGGFASAVMTEQQLAGLYGVDLVRRLRTRWQATKTTKTAVAVDKVIAFFAEANMTTDDASNIKRFVTPLGDGDFRVYRHEVSAKLVDLTVEHRSVTVATSNLGVRQLTIS
jgi:hypothetical protein